MKQYFRRHSSKWVATTVLLLIVVVVSTIILFNTNNYSPISHSNPKISASLIDLIIPQLKSIIKIYPDLAGNINYVLEIQPKTIYGKQNWWYNKNIDDFVKFFTDWLTFPFYPGDPSMYAARWQILTNMKIFERNIPGTPDGAQTLVSAADILFNVDSYGPTGGQSDMSRNAFDAWLTLFMDARGQFIKSPASAKYMTKILSTPKAKKTWSIDEVIIPDGGFKTWEELFLRKFKPGMRPDPAPGNDCIVVSPAEGSIMWLFHNITKTDGMPVKGDWLNLQNLFFNKPYVSRFIGGTVMDLLLWFTNYHWFHAPVTGTIIEISHYPGSYNYNFRRENWYLDAAKHNRTIIIYDTKDFGLVAMVPVGFGPAVGGVTITVKVGDYVQKGTPVGHFDYSGSSVLLIFERNKVNITIPYTGPMKSNPGVPNPEKTMGPAIPVKVNEKLGDCIVSGVSGQWR